MNKRDLVWTIIKIAREHRKTVEKRVCSLGIHPSQHHLLMYIARNEFCTQNSIAEAMEISAATVAVSLKKMEKGGYIEKQTSNHDNRSNKIALTEKGKYVAEHSERMFDEVDRKMFSSFTEEEQVEFYSYMERIVSNLKSIAEGNPLLAKAGEHFAPQNKED